MSGQLEATERKAAVSDTILKNITKERDSAISQLGVAYFTIEELKSENKKLADEIHGLRLELGLISIDLKDEITNEARKKDRVVAADRRQSSDLNTGANAYSKDDEQPIEASVETFDRKTKQLTNADNTRIQFKDRLAAHKSEKSQTRRQAGSGLKVFAQYDNNRLSHHAQSYATESLPLSEQTQRSVKYPEGESSEDSGVEHFHRSPSRNNTQQSNKQHDGRTQNATRELTYLSILEVMTSLPTTTQPKLTRLSRMMR